MPAKKDFTQVAFEVFKRAVGEEPASPPTRTPRQLNSSKGGVKGGASRAAKLTPEQRSEIARLAAQARWKKSP
jgi:hypothetical protein